MSELEYVEIFPKIYVYRNVLKDPKQMYDVMNESEKTSEGKYALNTWDPWAHFGTYTQKKHPSNYPKDLLTDPMFIKEKNFIEEVESAYDKVISDYIQKQGIVLPSDWIFSGCSYSKYNPNVDSMANNMTMQYHTDYIISEKDMPGNKFFITCTMYINDDYDGGDIEFYVDGKLINHKPVAGDILVFPSNVPYFHGVKIIKEKEKFFVRNFVMVPYDGSPEWLASQKRFGAHNWFKKEADRIAYDNPRNMVYLVDDTPVDFDTYKSRKDNPYNQGSM